MKFHPCGLVLLVALLSVSCEKPTEQPVTEPQVSPVGDTYLMFGIRPDEQNSSDAVKRYQAVYVADGKTARFDIELAMARASGSPIPVAFTKGRFIAVPGSDCSGLLRALQKTLQAKALPENSPRVSELPFKAVILGDHGSHSPNGGFAVNPPGNWTTIKLFLGDKSSEVFLNLNTALGKGEFSQKDPEYGDGVLTELAKVL